MRNTLLLVTVVSAVLTSPGYAQPMAGAPADAFQVRYASNLAVGDSVVDITNAGTQNTATGGLTNICANVYTFSPDEQLVSCCSCTITPNALQALSVNSDLISNTLTPAHPTAVVVKIMFTYGIPCNASVVPTAAQLATGGVAWGTTLHAAPSGSLPGNAPLVAQQYALSETRFSNKGLSTAELARNTSFCGFIQSNGSSYGICRSCRLGGLGSVKQ
jgi:hypothetical protein